MQLQPQLIANFVDRCMYWNITGQQVGWYSRHCQPLQGRSMAVPIGTLWCYRSKIGRHLSNIPEGLVRKLKCWKINIMVSTEQLGALLVRQPHYSQVLIFINITLINTDILSEVQSRSQWNTYLHISAWCFIWKLYAPIKIRLVLCGKILMQIVQFK